MIGAQTANARSQLINHVRDVVFVLVFASQLFGLLYLVPAQW
ncbi:hypothetical protein SAMN05421853_11777 [Roseivivax halotolerans]|uniref:Uncharacterized protein n=1 Tax=Roseivivax halotolerans TaxID=93684 RepID=A0A1I6AD22_9RHOB|nr:hypothetical protein SAMN05421853_11777 [Roseivivax halotolerans]